MQRSLVREWLVMALVLAIGLAAAAGRWFGRFDQAFYDMVMAVWRRAPSAEIVIVAIDDPSSAAIGRWPWPRQIHATVIDRIAQAGPAVLAVDMILAEPDLENPRADQLLAMALAQLPVVLPIYIEATGTASAGATMREVPPIKRFADAARALGHIDGEIDLDGIARRVYLRQGIGVAKHWQLAAAAVEIAKPGTLNETIGARHLAAPLSAASVVRDQRFIIPFTGPPGQIERISYAALLRGEVPAERLRGRIVFLGATATGLGDAYPTPVSGESVAMPGIEINANVLTRYCVVSIFVRLHRCCKRSLRRWRYWRCSPATWCSVRAAR